MFTIICIPIGLIILCLPIFSIGLEINDIKDFDRNAIKTVLNNNDNDNLVDILKQNVKFIDEYNPFLNFIEREEDSTLNIYKVLDLYTKNNHFNKNVSIELVQKLIQQGFACAVVKNTSLYLFVLLHDLKKLKPVLESQKKNAEEKKEHHKGPTQFEPTEYGVEVAVTSETDINKFFAYYFDDRTISDCIDWIDDSAEYDRLVKRFGIRLNTNLSDGEPSNPGFVFILFYSEYIWSVVLRKQATLKINYDVQFEMLKVIFDPGNSYSHLTTDYINDVACVLQEMLKIVDEEMSSQCVDHKGSFAKKYELFNKHIGDKFMNYLSDIDHGRVTEDISRFHLDVAINALKMLIEFYGVGESNNLEPPNSALNYPNCSQRFTQTTNDDVLAMLRKLYSEKEDVSVEQEIVRMESTGMN